MVIGDVCQMSVHSPAGYMLKFSMQQQDTGRIIAVKSKNRIIPKI